MRTELEKLVGERRRFRAVVEDFGVGRNSKRKETILLVDVRLANDLQAIVADHLWLKKSGSFRDVAIGDVVEFDAEVEPYEKGYLNFQQGVDETTVDYRLTKPSNVQVIAKDGSAPKPE
jgi:hypothetical protein